MVFHRTPSKVCRPLDYFLVLCSFIHIYRLSIIIVVIIEKLFYCSRRRQHNIHIGFLFRLRFFLFFPDSVPSTPTGTAALVSTASMTNCQCRQINCWTFIPLMICNWQFTGQPNNNELGGEINNGSMGRHVTTANTWQPPVCVYVPIFSSSEYKFIWLLTSISNLKISFAHIEEGKFIIWLLTSI